MLTQTRTTGSAPPKNSDRGMFRSSIFVWAKWGGVEPEFARAEYRRSRFANRWGDSFSSVDLVQEGKEIQCWSSACIHHPPCLDSICEVCVICLSSISDLCLRRSEICAVCRCSNCVVCVVHLWSICVALLSCVCNSSGQQGR